MFKSKSLQLFCDILYDEMNDPLECWEWNGTVNNKGYGRVYHDGRYWLVHRLSYTLIKGQISEGFLVLHRCDNSICFNPNHLRVGTHADNAKDRYDRGRGKKPSSLSVNENTRLNRKGHIVYVRKDYKKKGRFKN